MSREQWGHGFYSGLAAAKHRSPKYCITYDSNKHIEYIFALREKHGETYVMEAVPYFWFVYYGTAEPQSSPVDYECIYEKTGDELAGASWVWSWASVLKALAEDERRYKNEERNRI